jgi:type IV pilus assembly protein PilO
MRFGFRELIFLVVLVAVPTVSLFYVFKPRNDEIKEALEEIDVKRTRLEKLEEVTAQIDDLGLAIEEGRESIAQIEKKLPNEQDVEGILAEVWQIATSNHLSVKSVKSDKQAPAARYREQPLKMVVEGQFDGFYQFLLDVEKLPRITRIHDLSLERQTTRRSATSYDGLPPGAMKAEFTLSIYFEPGPSEPSA